MGCSTRGGLPITTSKQTPSQPLTCASAQLENFGTSSWRWMRTYMGVTTFPSYLTVAEYIPQHQVPRWIIDRANWDQFTKITEQIAGIPDSEPLEFHGQIIGNIIEGATKSTPKSDGYHKVAPVPWWNANCTNLKKECLKALKQANRHPTVSNKIKYEHLRALFQRAQKDSQNSFWKKYVSTLNSSIEDVKVWKKVDKIKGRYQPKPPTYLKSKWHHP